jgi:CDGSH-type Zn-finger protein
VSAVKIKVSKDGPYLVRGDVELEDAEGKTIPITSQPCALCRCGQSANKPFCDGSHVAMGFKG